MYVLNIIYMAVRDLPRIKSKIIVMISDFMLPKSRTDLV